MGSQKHEPKMKKMMNSGKFKCPKKTIKILLSVSVFTFLFSQSSLFPVLLHYFDQFAPNFSIKFFTFESDRNFIFLVCNGILVLIIKNSGLVRKPPTKIPVDLTHHVIQQKIKEEEPKFKEKQIHDDEEGRENGDREKEALMNEEEEEEVEVLSADELNKKCDEFIKKVKQEIQNP